MLKVGFVNTNKNTIIDEFLKYIEIKDSVNIFRELIDCDTITITRRKVGNKYFNFIVDDEGLFKNKLIFGALSPDCKIGLAGNLIITNQSGAKLTSLSEEDFDYLKHFIGMSINTEGDIEYVLILNND